MFWGTRAIEISPFDCCLHLLLEGVPNILRGYTETPKEHKELLLVLELTSLGIYPINHTSLASMLNELSQGHGKNMNNEFLKLYPSPSSIGGCLSAKTIREMFLDKSNMRTVMSGHFLIPRLRPFLGVGGAEFKGHMVPLVLED